MLKKGLAWHYIAYDQRPELARVSNALSSTKYGTPDSSSLLD